ncbi:MAG: hypothetical protein E7660_04130 [Ruminococcaceae bacterium]|nr:hypothetical protein [Oscillospiraceae bacterium]
MKRIICITVPLFMLLSLFSCGAKTADVTGRWETAAVFGDDTVSLSYEFFEDGTGRYEMEGFSADKFTYEVSGDIVILTVGSEIREIPFSVEKDTLILEIEGQSIRLEKN